MGGEGIERDGSAYEPSTSQTMNMARRVPGGMLVFGRVGSWEWETYQAMLRH